jgi:Response regulator receiver domain
MDIRMPEHDGIEATRRILASPRSRSRIIILTTFDLDEYVYDALRAGATGGFLLKDAPPEQPIHAIHTVADGDALLAPSVTRRLIGQFASRPAPHNGIPPPLSELTPRESRRSEWLRAASPTRKSHKRSCSAKPPSRRTCNILVKLDPPRSSPGSRHHLRNRADPARNTRTTGTMSTPTPAIDNPAVSS